MSGIEENWLKAWIQAFARKLYTLGWFLIQPMALPIPVAIEKAQISGIHKLSVAEVLSVLNSRPGGLSQDEARQRLQQVGPNVITKVKGKPLWVRFLANFTHVMAILLWVGGIVGFMAQMPQLGIAIWMVNIINGVFSFWQEFKAEKATEALQELLPSYARVMRDGEELRILAEELAPGDVILLEEGDRISADARLIKESELVVCSLASLEFSVPRVISRVNNPKNAWLYTPEMGMDVALNQADLLAHLIADEMSLGDM